MARNKYPEETIARILASASTLFFTKGYDNTSIQDIINDLGNLSKGAIYHHFKSKGAIFDAISTQASQGLLEECLKIKNLPNKTPNEKINLILKLSLINSGQDVLLQSIPNLLDNPQLLAMHLEATINEVALKIILPIIEEGIAAGLIKTEYPKELAEAFAIMIGIWLNPAIFEMDSSTIMRKSLFLNEFFKPYGLDILDEEILTNLGDITTKYGNN